MNFSFPAHTWRRKFSKSAAHFCRFRRFGVAAALCLLAQETSAETARRVVQIDTKPADTKVEIVLTPAKNQLNRQKTWTSPAGKGSGFQTEAFKFTTGDRITVTVSRANHQTTNVVASFEHLRDSVALVKGKRSELVVIPVTLAELQREMDVEFVANGEFPTRFFVGTDTQPTKGSRATLTFSRTDANSPWKPVLVRAEQSAYKTKEVSINLSDVETAPRSGDIRRLTLTLDKIEERRELRITTNEKGNGAEVYVNNIRVGVAPMDKLVLMFNRADARSPWSTNVVRVQKPDYEYRLQGQMIGIPAFETNLSLRAVADLQLSGLHLDGFDEVRFFEVPLRRFVVSRGEVTLQTTNSFSEKSPKQIVGLSQFGEFRSGDPFVLGRIGALAAAGNVGELVVAMPFVESREGQKPEIRGSAIWLLTGASRALITDEELDVYDIDPCICMDRKMKTVFYSSNRRGQRGIWKKVASSGGARAPIDPGRGTDVEPAVFTSNEGIPRLAFTRYFPNAAPGTPPRIIVQSEDGSVFGETENGTSPAWSNDGARIAYVNLKGEICSMDAKGGDSKILSQDIVASTPVWLPGDKSLIFAAAQARVDARDGTGNYDLIVHTIATGARSVIIESASFEGMPVVTWDPNRLLIYFVSNRGAQRAGAESWRIWSYEYRE